MNPVFILTYGNLDLTKLCVESIRNQDIETTIFAIDNGSEDGSVEWLREEGILFRANPTNEGFSAGINAGLAHIFEELGLDHCLVPNSDTILPPWYYRTLLETDLPFVTGTAVDRHSDVVQPETITEATRNPDFSAFLVTKDAWESIGRFDETMVNYSSDQDYHLRGWMLGIPMGKIALPYYHEGSATIKFSQPKVRKGIENRAGKDREKLTEKWHVSAGGPDYEALFSPENFGSWVKKENA